jgi:broad-specificity NMP kinase
MRINHANEEKLRVQMAKRGWTEAQITEALQTQGIPARGQ